MKLVHVDMGQASSEALTAFGPLLPFSRVHFPVSRSAQRDRRYPRGAHAVAVSASLRLRCGARLEVAPRTRFVRCAHYAQTGGAKSVVDARCARRLQDCADQSHRNRPPRVAPAAPPPIGCLRSRTPALLAASSARQGQQARALSGRRSFFSIASNPGPIARRLPRRATARKADIQKAATGRKQPFTPDRRFILRRCRLAKRAIDMIAARHE